jgi:uncharacterized membrane protein
MATDPTDVDRQNRRYTPSAEDVLEGGSAEARSPQGILERYPSRYASKVSGIDPARALGYVSLGLGLAGLLAPRAMSQLIGMPGTESLLRFVGARELASGAGLLTQQKTTPWLWSRVVGDAMDLTLLGVGMRPSNPYRERTAGAMLAVAAITALDVAASLRESSQPREAFRAARSESERLIEHTVSVNREPQECYAFWRDVSNLSKFSPMLEKVTPIDERRSHWVLRGLAGAKIEWDSEITVDRPADCIAWHSLTGAVKHAGRVRFERAPGGRGTFVSAMMHYQPPGGRLATGFAKLLGKDPNHQVREDLRRFKSLIETGEVPSTRGQPSGRRSFIGRMTRDGRQSREGVRS